MNDRIARLLACCLALHATWPAMPYAQPAANPGQAGAESTQAQAFNTEQIDALLAPIALYPDTLLTQILMASTFPLQVVQAARWAQDPAHKGLTGDALTKALEPESWDPSVKSLIPFPEVLAMMNTNLDWMQQLGYAFADEQAAVLDSVQRLRRQAQSNGSLQSTPQQVVRTEQQTIVIEPAQPNVVYVPSYNPTAVYGTWPYASYPPVYLPPPPGYAVGTALATGLAFGAGVAITAGLWNWASPGWNSGNVNVNVNRYNNINANRAAIKSGVWQPNRPGGRPAGLARPPGGPAGNPARLNGLPAGAIGRSQVSVPGSAVRTPARSASLQGTGANRPATPRAGQGGLANRSTANRPGGGANRPAQLPTTNRPARQAGTAGGNRQSFGNALNRPSAPTRPAAFSSLKDGRQAAQFGQRGAQSRSLAQAQRPGGFGGARAGGGARGGGGGRRGGGRR